MPNYEMRSRLLSLQATRPPGKSRQCALALSFPPSCLLILYTNILVPCSPSTWCYWALYLLSKHPDVQEKVYQNILKHSSDGQGMTLEDIEKMDYLDAFLKEVLRLYPSVTTLIRHTIKDDTFNGTSVPKGTRINIPILILHRSDRYWDKPMECLPERWMNPDKPPHSHPYAYLPFSHGPRNCLGYRFATFECKLILAPLIRAFKFQLAPSMRNTELKLKTQLSLRSDPSVKVVAQSR